MVKLLTDHHKCQRMGAALIFLEADDRHGDSLIDQIVTGHETWVRHVNCTFLSWSRKEDFEKINTQGALRESFRSKIELNTLLTLNEVLVERGITYPSSSTFLHPSTPAITIAWKSNEGKYTSVKTARGELYFFWGIREENDGVFTMRARFVTQNRHECNAHHHGCENVLSRNIQNETDHPRIRNSKKNIYLHFPAKKGHSGFDRGPLDQQTNALPLSYTPALAKHCFAFHRTDTKRLCLELSRTGLVISFL
ncbi:hypothetical protein TNCV_4011631 [Trichonephila clavipes]|nr:hypothetical protein TNCV_4011631 [Trichonephila clavipes]